MYDILAVYRVVDVVRWAFIPDARGPLADWGADVVKVVHPRYSDRFRKRGGPVGDLPKRDDVDASFMWEILNRGNRSVERDLSRPQSCPCSRRWIAMPTCFSRTSGRLDRIASRRRNRVAGREVDTRGARRPADQRKRLPRRRGIRQRSDEPAGEQPLPVRRGTDLSAACARTRRAHRADPPRPGLELGGHRQAQGDPGVP